MWTGLDNGLTESDGHKNDGPSKLQDIKLQAMKMQDKKYSVDRDTLSLQ